MGQPAPPPVDSFFAALEALESHYAGVTIPQWESAPEARAQATKRVLELGAEMSDMDEALWARAAATRAAELVGNTELDYAHSAGCDAIALARAYMTGDSDAADAVLATMTYLEHELTLVSAASMLGDAIKLLADNLATTPDQLLSSILAGIESTVLEDPPT